MVTTPIKKLLGQAIDIYKVKYLYVAPKMLDELSHVRIGVFISWPQFNPGLGCSTMVGTRFNILSKNEGGWVKAGIMVNNSPSSHHSYG